MATSKKEPPNPSSRDRATRMSPNLRPSSSESSSGYGARRARSVPSSPDRKFGPSSSSTAASGSPDVYRPSLSLAGRCVSSSMSSSGSSIHGSRAQPFTGAVPKPTLVRVKSDKTTATSQRLPALAVTPSNSFKDMAKTAAASKAPSSTLQKSKLSPRPSAGKAALATPKPSTQRAVAPGAVRGGRTQPVSSVREPSAAAKKRTEVANGGGGAAASSRARNVPQRAMEASASSKEKEEEPSMQFEESESISTPSIEEHLHKQLPDPVDLKSMYMAAPASAQPDQQEPYSDHQQQGKNGDEVKGYISEEKEDAGGSELRNGGQGADGSAKNKLDIIKAADESEQVEKEEAKAKADKVVPVWRKDDPKSNDVIEETKSKLLKERKSRVKALVGAFETVMPFKE